MAGSRLFDGIDDAITLAAGRASPTASFTLALCIKPASSTEQFFIGSGNLTLGQVTGTPILALYNGSNAAGTGTTTPVVGAWQVIVASKAAGATGAVRFSRLTFSDSRIVHETSGSTQPDNTTASHVVGSAFGGYFFNGLMAAAAVFPTVLSDSDRATLASFSAWRTLSPAALWRLDGDPGTPVTDDAGNGASQTAIVGTAHSADEPAGFWPVAPTARRQRRLLLGVG